MSPRARRTQSTNLPSGVRARLDNDPAALEMFHVEPPAGEKSRKPQPPSLDPRVVSLTLIGLAGRIAEKNTSPPPPRRLRAVPDAPARRLPAAPARPAPPDPFAAGRFVRHIQLRLERLDGENAGKMRISSPQARGWAATVRPYPDPLWKAIREAFSEATIAGYAAWQGANYDQDALTEADDPSEPARQTRASAEKLVERANTRTVVSWSRYSNTRPDVVKAEDWTPLANGRWLSPTGRSFRADASQVQRMLRRRALDGLPCTYEEWVLRAGTDHEEEDTS